jgi:hypothetical protein
MLDDGGSYAIAFADLLHGELTTANAASPAGRRRMSDSGHWALIGASGSHQFITALRTLSLNHKAPVPRKIVWSPSSTVNCQGGSFESPQP